MHKQKILRPFEVMYRHRRRVILVTGLIFGAIVIGQLVYPRNRLVPFAMIDSVDVGSTNVAAATHKLDAQSQAQKIAVKLSGSKNTYTEVVPADIGMTVSNQARVTAAQYPWYMRLIPTSLLWQHFILSEQKPDYKIDRSTAESYLSSLAGSECEFKPQNATLEYKNNSLVVINAKDGGTCNKEAALRALLDARPTITHPGTIVFDVALQTPAVSNETAMSLKDSILSHTTNGVNVTISETTKNIPKPEVLSWLTFAPKENALVYAFDEEKAKDYFATSNISDLVSVTASQTEITTRDFTVISKKKGSDGLILSLSETLENVRAVIDGTANEAKIETTASKPTPVSYIRTYTKTSTGIRALITQYAQDNPGTFGISFRQLNGNKFSADYNATQQFTAASTYKLFVAYGVLRRVDSGKWHWTDANISNGRNLSTCFDAMIKVSDNSCAEALLNKIGRSQLTSEIHGLGLNNSTFLADYAKTTAGDLALFLQKLQNSQLPIQASGRSRLINNMKVQIYRQGIPAGASGTTADKVGFLWGLLHDAAIVYSPKGTYVLTVMSDGSSWSKIADLTSKIEDLL